MINKLFNHIKKHKLVYGIGAFAVVAVLVVFTLKGDGLNYASKLAGNINWTSSSISEEKFNREVENEVEQKILEIGKNKWKNLSEAEKDKKMKGIYEELGRQEWNAMGEREKDSIVDLIIKKLIKKYGLTEIGEAKMKSVESGLGTVNLSGVQLNCGTVIVERVKSDITLPPIYLWDGNDKTVATINSSDPNVYTGSCLPLGNYSVFGQEGGIEEFKVKSIKDANGNDIQNKTATATSNKQKLIGGGTIKFIVEFDFNKSKTGKTEELKSSNTGKTDLSGAKKTNTTTLEKTKNPDTGTADLSGAQKSNAVELQKPSTDLVDPSAIKKPNYLIPNNLP